MSEPRDHHFVPRFYLARWCNSEGKLTVYSRPHRSVVTSQLTPKGTGFERDLYTYTGVPSPQALETKFMARIDDVAAPILDKLLAGGLPNLTGAERSDFTRFVLSLRARHPGAVTLSKSEGERALSYELDRDPEQYLAIKGDEPASNLREFLEQNAPHVAPNFGLSMLPKVITHPEVGQRVYSMPWSTFNVSRANTDLLTSDRPCVLEGNAVDGRCVIVLPLNPAMVVIISNDATLTLRLRRLTHTGLVKLVNRAVVSHAHKYVYGTGRQHLSLVEKLLGSRDPGGGIGEDEQPDS